MIMSLDSLVTEVNLHQIDLWMLLHLEGSVCYFMVCRVYFGLYRLMWTLDIVNFNEL